MLTVKLGCGTESSAKFSFGLVQTGLSARETSVHELTHHEGLVYSYPRQITEKAGEKANISGGEQKANSLTALGPHDLT